MQALEKWSAIERDSILSANPLSAMQLFPDGAIEQGLIAPGKQFRVLRRRGCASKNAYLHQVYLHHIVNIEFRQRD
jgi:hypothetical protein